jgi:hypothetical protein
MTTMIQGTQLRAVALGNGPVSKAVPTLSATTFQLFTVAGGQVLITALWGVVTTNIAAVGGTLALQIDPTAGDTATVVTATDLGTSDATVGTTIGVRDQGDGTTDFVEGGFALSGLVVPVGDVELVGASGVDGGITIYCTWIPLLDGATLVAAA